MGSKTSDGVWFICYSKDHPPPHVHGQYADTIVIVDLLRTVRRRRRSGGTPSGRATRTERCSVYSGHGGTVCGRAEGTLGEDLVLTRTEQDLDGAPLTSAVDEEIRLVKAAYHPGPGLEFLELTLSDGRRLLVPCEDLPELKGASPEQIADFSIGPHGSHVWWRQIDDGIYLPEFLEFRWGNVGLVDRRDGGCRYRVEGLE